MTVISFHHYDYATFLSFDGSGKNWRVASGRVRKGMKEYERTQQKR